MTEWASAPSQYIAGLEIERLLRCLAPCTECTGIYVSEVLGRRFICCCGCHVKSKELIGSSHTDKVDRNSRQAVTRYLNETDKEEEQKSLSGTSQGYNHERQVVSRAYVFHHLLVNNNSVTNPPIKEALIEVV